MLGKNARAGLSTANDRSQVRPPLLQPLPGKHLTSSSQQGPVRALTFPNASPAPIPCQLAGYAGCSPRGRERVSPPNIPVLTPLPARDPARRRCMPQVGSHVGPTLIYPIIPTPSRQEQVLENKVGCHSEGTNTPIYGLRRTLLPPPGRRLIRPQARSSSSILGAYPLPPHIAASATDGGQTGRPGTAL